MRHIQSHKIKLYNKFIHRHQMRAIQNSFVFIQPKKRQTASRFDKPSTHECRIAQKKMCTTDVKVCAVCWREDDNDTNNSNDVAWIACTKCELWIHRSCIATQNIEQNEFYCENCK